jgi:histidinol-phosphate aminotransferase
LNRFKNIVVTRTFSKIYGLAGLRVGYGVGNAALLQNLNKTREPFNVNSLAQAAASAALEDEDFVRQSIDNNEKGKKQLYDALNQLGLKYYPTAANFIFITIPLDCMVAFQKLMELGVTIRPMKSFGVMNAIRVSIGTPEQNRFFIGALKKVLSN